MIDDDDAERETFPILAAMIVLAAGLDQPGPLPPRLRGRPPQFTAAELVAKAVAYAKTQMQRHDAEEIAARWDLEHVAESMLAELRRSWLRRLH
jgi:hypothetical protein